MDVTNLAAARIIQTTSIVHSDYIKVRSDAVDVPVGELAKKLCFELVFPSLLSGGSAVISTMASGFGPLGFVGNLIVSYPLRMVKSRVFKVLDGIGLIISLPLGAVAALSSFVYVVLFSCAWFLF